MNKEKIESAALEYMQKAKECNMVNDFIAGAEWVLSNQWINIKEQTPKDFTSVIFACPILNILKGFYAYGEFISDGSRRLKIEEVFYWMPIPELPRKKE